MLGNVQVLRALGALMVLLYHSYPHYRAMGGDNEFIGGISRWGFCGVDLFFVISGFIITHTTISRPRGIASALYFIKHRLAKIFLGYWPFFAISFALALGSPPHTVKAYDLWGSLFLINVQQQKLILTVSWSLTYELCFYGIFTCLFWCSRRHIQILLPVALFAAATLQLVIPSAANDIIGFFSAGFLVEFLAGALVRIYLFKPISGPLRWACFAGALVFAVLGTKINAVTLPAREYSFGTASILILIFSVTASAQSGSALHRLLRKLGDSSYTLYLSHLPIISVFYLIGARDLLTGKPALAMFGIAVLLGLCIAFSYAFYFSVELPLYSWAVGRTEKQKLQHQKTLSDHTS
jgi:exopolysaccharide production protein ExoZ